MRASHQSRGGGSQFAHQFRKCAGADYGHEQHVTLDALCQPCLLDRAGGDAAGARDQFAALLPIRERIQGPEHPETLADRHNLARWTRRTGGRGWRTV